MKMFEAKISDLIRGREEVFVKETLHDIDRFAGTDRTRFFR